MATYQFLGESGAMPYGQPGAATLHRTVDFADLILNPGKLALASTPTVPLTAFVGLAAADVLQLFHLPAKCHVISMGLSVTSADTNACTLALGDGSSTAGFGAAKVINAVASQITLVGDAFGPDSTTGKFYASADTLDALSATATAIDAVVDFWANVAFVG